ncbi:MAG TPA: hypothetical protein RMH99_16225 [Sandaracinaceae bacterium LLY-WYZ-13_1]|nr:hypothetical protein [Sandaracinaceae bacterium LLY-WYZ-13_1]
MPDAADSPHARAPRRLLLESLLADLPGEVPRSRVTAAVAAREEERWYEWLARVADMFGWDAVTLEAPVGAVEAEPDAWWIARGEGPEAPWLVVGVDGRHGLANVIEGTKAREVAREPARLAEALGLDDPEATIRWVRLTTALPLEALRSPPGEHLRAQSRLWRWTKREKKTLLAVLAYSAVIGIISLALPLAVQSLVNLLAFGRVLQPLLVISVALLLVLSLAAALRVLEVYIVELLQRRALVDVARDVARRLPKTQATAGGRWGLTERVNRFFDVVGLQKSASYLLLNATEVVMSTLAGLVLLAFYHPYLLAFVLVLLAVLAFIVFRLGASGVETAVKESEAKYALAAWLETVARRQRIFVEPEAADWSARRTDRLTLGWLSRRSRHFAIVLRQTIGFAGTQAIASATLLGLGSFLVWSGELSLGQLVAAELIITGVLAQIAKFGKHVEAFYDVNASVDKLGMLIDLETEPTNGELLPTQRQGIRVDLDDVPLRESRCSLHVAPGDRVVLEGMPSSERRHLFDLLYLRRRPSPGRSASYDGLALDSLAPRLVRDRVELIRGGEPIAATLEENLTLDAGRATAEELRHVLERVGLGAALASLPGGLQTWIYPSGEPFRPDELVLIEVARCLLSEPRLVLVDGSLDGLGDRDREALWSLLADEERPWTLVVATDREDLAARAPRRVRWRGGTLESEEEARP